jgi:hypothetical protein
MSWPWSGLMQICSPQERTRTIPVGTGPFASDQYRTAGRLSRRSDQRPSSGTPRRASSERIQTQQPFDMMR